jgi:hypothetical protein
MPVIHLVVAVLVVSVTSLKHFLAVARPLVPVMDGEGNGSRRAHHVVKTLKL